MSTTAMPARHYPSTAVGVPVTLGIAFGLYVAWLESNNGASNTRITVAGLVGGAACAVLCFALGMVQHRLRREVRAASYGAIFGAVMGYMLNVSGQTWLEGTLMGLILGLSMAVVTFYIRYTQET
ncbi:hypothetical protein [Streptomyces sp. bgisy100]|uniref:hypothetical protein n=1 Tax=Streptomyces sp. bgisy100 TaxID=3413783 RepID=UPI003D7207C1